MPKCPAEALQTPLRRLLSAGVSVFGRRLPLRIDPTTGMAAVREPVHFRTAFDDVARVYQRNPKLTGTYSVSGPVVFMRW
jgi:hypothetical protein